MKTEKSIYSSFQIIKVPVHGCLFRCVTPEWDPRQPNQGNDWLSLKNKRCKAYPLIPSSSISTSAVACYAWRPCIAPPCTSIETCRAGGCASASFAPYPFSVAHCEGEDDPDVLFLAPPPHQPEVGTSLHSFPWLI
jgi:hypothetical protein